MNGPATDAPGRMSRVRARWPRTKKRLRRAVPFASGIVAALVGVWIFTALNPGPAPLSTADIQKTVDQTLASQTPAPPTGTFVYGAVAQSLVLIEAKGSAVAGQQSDGFGSGVIVDDRGDILT